VRVVSADLWEPAPGRVVTWDVRPGPGSVPAPAVPTFNQRNHLLGAAAGEPSVWITAAFDVDGPVDVAALEAAFAELVARHADLRVEAVRGATPTDVGLVRHAATALVWTRHDGPATGSVEETRDHLVAALGRRCAPFGYPAFLPAAISREGRSTVVLGMDHLHTDAWSTAVVVEELAAAYAAYAGRAAAPASGAAVVREVVAPGPVPDPGPSADREPDRGVAADDPRLAAWHGFLHDRGGALPTFPLPLGVPEGARLPQRTVVAPLCDAAVADAVGERARAAGASTSAAVLATLARAVADLGGPEVLETLLPVHTRTDAATRGAVGWHTTTVPLRVDVAGGGRGQVQDTDLAATGKALRAARELAAVPLERVVESLPRPLRFPRVDIFQVSYLDYRRLPGYAAAVRHDAHHVSAATRADDLQLWVSRTADGVAVRARLPRTPEATTTVDALLSGWSDLLRTLADRRGAVARTT